MYDERYGSTNVNFDVKLAIAIIIAIVKRMSVAFYIVTYHFIYRDQNRSAHDKTTLDTFERHPSFYVFITTLFSKWVWYFKETFNEKNPRIPHAPHVLNFSISFIRLEDVQWHTLYSAYFTPSSCREFAPSALSSRSINLGGTVGHAMRQRFVTFSLFAEALCLYFSRATHFIWIYRPVLFMCNSYHVYLYHDVLIRVIFQKIRTTFTFLYKCGFSGKSRFTRNTHINSNELSS